MDAAALIARTTVLEEYVIEAKRQDKRKAFSQSEGGIVAVGSGGGAVEKNSAALMPLLGAATGAAAVASASVAASGDAILVPLDADFAGAGAPGALRQSIYRWSPVTFPPLPLRPLCDVPFPC